MNKMTRDVIPVLPEYTIKSWLLTNIRGRIYRDNYANACFVKDKSDSTEIEENG